jgi:hypothetical protein
MLSRVAQLTVRALLHAAGQASHAMQAEALACSSARMQGAISPAHWRMMSTNSHDIFNTHRDTPQNNADTTFEWTAVRC